MEPTKLRNFLNSREAAKELGISVSRLRQLVNKGEIPCSRTPGGLLLFDRIDIYRAKVKGELMAAKRREQIKSWKPWIYRSSSPKREKNRSS